MESDPIPSLDEVALGAFLEDIGKFMQRAHAGNGELPQQVSNRASVVLPGFQGRSSHWHALWTDAFFDEMERRGVSLPGGINLARVRDAAVYHHNPGNALQWLSAEADRLSAGMDRKPLDEQDEAQDSGARGGFRRVALRSIFANVDLGRGSLPLPASCVHPVSELTAGALAPGVVDGGAQIEAYRALWPKFVDGFEALCRDARNTAALHDGLVSLSERFTWAIPSSTIDQPDVPLHDHDKSVAAIASCLYRYHAERGELADIGRIRDRTQPKFHFLVGDLSGIQASLFRLAAQQVKGAARILRARSFLMATFVEAAALLCRQAFGLPAYCELQAAGGRFVLLVPALSDAPRRVEEVQRHLDAWICDRYSGDLAINLALGPALSGRDLMRERFEASWATIGRCAEEAKLRALSTVEHGVLAHDFDERGPCPACGVRPATESGSDRIRRCVACNDEFETGRRLPDACTVLWVEGELPGDLAAHHVAMPGGLTLALLTAPLRLDDADAWRRVRGGWRIAHADAGASPPSVRYLATHVPRLTAADLVDRRFSAIDDEFEPGDIKTFAHLAELAREKHGDNFVGRRMLGVLKADVDMLGQVFGRGLGADRSLGRMATLSRMTDAFFTVVLPDLLRREFPDTYTVYAGGDDLLMLGPWHAMLRLAVRLEDSFRRHVGSNQNLTLSAAVELCGVDEPLNRAVRRAEARLGSAKEAGRNRVCAIDPVPIGWDTFDRTLGDAAKIDEMIRNGLSTAFVYKTLHFARARARAESKERHHLRDADWRARWAYHLRRTFPDQNSADALRFFDGLLGSGLVGGRSGPGTAAPSALVVALYRNR